MQKLLFPWSWAVSPSIQMFLPTWKLQETLLLGLYRAPSHRHNQLLIPFSAPLPSVKNAERGFSMSSFSSWLDVPGDQSPSWSPPGVISLKQDIPLLLSSLWNLLGFQFYARYLGQRPICIFYLTMDASQKHDIMFNKSDAKDYKAYNFIYMKFQKRQDNSDKKQISDSQMPGSMCGGI